MFSKLGILKQNVIFLFIGSKELYFIRFIKGKIFSTRSYKTTYSTEHDSIKTFFKDYFIGKEGIPVCIIYDIPNQIFTEYKFLKSINAQAVHQSIIKKITQEVPQEAIHDYLKITTNDAKKTENVYQVVSLIRTPVAHICTDLLQKFPNPIAGYFSIILEMPSICEGNTKRINLPKAIPVIEQDALDIKEEGVDDLNIAIQHSPISGINFSLYQGNRVLFHHHVVCNKIDDDTQKEVNTTATTIVDYCTQLNVEYQTYIYGSEVLLKSILKTNIEVKSLYYTQAEVSDAKFFYHKQYNANFTKANTLDSIAFKCLYEPVLFIPNKNFFSAITKYYTTKFSLVLGAFLIIAFFVYELFLSSLSVLSSFTKYHSNNSLNISNVMNKVETLEHDINKKKAMVNFYSNFTQESYQVFIKQIRELVKGSVYIKNISYSCMAECNNANPSLEISISGNAQDLQDYYNLVSDIRRIFFRYDISRKIDEGTGNFSIQIIATNK